MSAVVVGSGTVWTIQVPRTLPSQVSYDRPCSLL